MDRERFDAMTRLVSTRQSRRATLLTILGATVLGQEAAATGKGRKRKRDRKRRRAAARQAGAEAVPANCYPGDSCDPGPGTILEDCDFGGTNTLANQDVSGAILEGANLYDADASGANFDGAILKGACLVDADLTDAIITNGTSLKNAVFCRTTMPDGTKNDSGCNRRNRCCPTCIPFRDPCGPGIGGVCCDGLTCSSGRCGCEDDGQCGPSEVCCDRSCVEGECCSTSECADQGGGFCSPDNECGSCTDACPGCDFCFRLTNGDSVCGSSAFSVECVPSGTDCPPSHPFSSNGGVGTGPNPIGVVFACPVDRRPCLAPGDCEAPGA